MDSKQFAVIPMRMGTGIKDPGQNKFHSVLKYVSWGITVPSGRMIAVTGARKSKEEPGNTGTLNLVQQWNIKMPMPAKDNAGDGLNCQ